VSDLSEPLNTWDASNKGASMISFETAAPENGMLNYRVLLIPSGVQPERAIPDFIDAAR